MLLFSHLGSKKVVEYVLESLLPHDYIYIYPWALLECCLELVIGRWTIIFFISYIIKESYKYILFLNIKYKEKHVLLNANLIEYVWSFSFKCFLARSLIKQREYYLPFNGRFNMYRTESRSNQLCHVSNIYYLSLSSC